MCIDKTFKTIRPRYQNMKTLVVVVLGCVLTSSQAHAQPAASAGSTTEQFVLKSDGTLVPVAGNEKGRSSWPPCGGAPPRAQRCRHT